jgi:hypothetical protein
MLHTLKLRREELTHTLPTIYNITVIETDTKYIINCYGFKLHNNKALIAEYLLLENFSDNPAETIVKYIYRNPAAFQKTKTYQMTSYEIEKN